jgi:hypothetical protein
VTQALAPDEVNDLLAEILGVIAGAFEGLGDKKNSAAVAGTIRANHGEVTAKDFVTGAIDFRVCA